MQRNDNYLLHMAEEDCEHCLFPDLQDTKQFAYSPSALDGDFRYNYAANAYNIPKMQHSKRSIYLSHNDFLILLTSV